MDAIPDLDAKLAVSMDTLVTEIYEHFQDLLDYQLYLDGVFADIPPGELDDVLAEILSV